MPDGEGLREQIDALADALEAEGRSLPPGGGAVVDTTACERIMTAHRIREVLASQPTAPGGDSRAEAREQIARWLVREYGELLDHDPPGYWEFQARELIADCPAVAEGLAAVDTVERVRRARRYGHEPFLSAFPGEIDRALAADGTEPCPAHRQDVP